MDANNESYSQSTVLDDQITPLPESRWVVQKYGGTSIGKFPMKVMDGIVSTQHRVAVVCSARSDTSKDSGTTSRLIRAIQQAQLPGKPDYAATVAIIRNEHVNSAAKIIKNANIVEQFVEDVDSEIAQVLLVLHCAQQAGSFTEEQNDFVIGRGEKLSCLFMAALVRYMGAEALCIDLADLLSHHSRHVKPPTQLGRSLYEEITREIRNRIQQDCKDGIPIITGFFGGMPGGLLNTVGRGYSDLCAALVAVALDAKELQIWKDVDGVFNADPRKIPTATLLETISPSEAAELSFYGAEVIHPSTVEHVMRANIPIRIKNVMKLASPGTTINPIDPHTARQVNSANEGASVGARDRNPAAKKPVAVSVKHDMLVLNVQTQDRSCSSCSFFAKVFSIVEQYNLRIDIISSSEMNVSLAMLPSDRTVAAIRGTTFGDLDDIVIKDPGLCSALDSLRRIGALDVLPNMAIISLIGDGLKQMVGVSAEFFGVLAENNINIEMISQGASETNISAVIERHQTDTALVAIHRKFFKILPRMSHIAGGQGLYLGA